MRPLVQFLDDRLPMRFWSKVQPCPMSGCWMWTGATMINGYGVFGVGGKKTNTSHRHAYLTLVGSVAAGLDLDHLCRVRACCNPSHLEPVTRQVNAARGVGGEIHAAKTRCPKGHPYTGVNLKIDKGGGRRCRVCKNEANRLYRFKGGPLRSLTPEQLSAVNAALAP